MKVRIGHNTYDANLTPIMLILEDQDKENIANMPKGEKKLACYPKGYDEKKIEKWMKG